MCVIQIHPCRFFSVIRCLTYQPFLTVHTHTHTLSLSLSLSLPLMEKWYLCGKSERGSFMPVSTALGTIDQLNLNNNPHFISFGLSMKSYEGQGIWLSNGHPHWVSVSLTISIEKYQVDQLFCLCLRKKNVQMEEVVGGRERESVCVCVWSQDVHIGANVFKALSTFQWGKINLFLFNFLQMKKGSENF